MHPYLPDPDPHLSPRARAAPACIISTAQQARPNVEPRRAQFATAPFSSFLSLFRPLLILPLAPSQGPVAPPLLSPSPSLRPATGFPSCASSAIRSGPREDVLGRRRLLRRGHPGGFDDVISFSIRTKLPFRYFEGAAAIGLFHGMRRGVLTSAAAGNSGLDGGGVSGGVSNVAPWMLSVPTSSTDGRLVDKLVLGNGKTIVGTPLTSSPS